MDFSGEAEFWRRYPQCKLTAVDPISEINKELVEQIPNARFFQAAISSKDEKHNAHIKQSKF
jgi:trans-aconitate methyltransferase